MGRASARFAGGMLVMLCIALLPHTSGAQPVARVVSINTCTDQLLLQLADRSQIASISYYTADPARSEMAAEAKGIPINHGLAEEVIPLSPGLVLAGTYSNRATLAMLRHLGFTVLQLPVAHDFDGIRSNIRMVAAALGHPDRGDQSIAGMDRRLAEAAFRGPGPKPVAAFFQPNSFTIGDGTLAHAVLSAAGFTNLAVKLGMSGTHRLPLELLLQAQPDVLVMDPPMLRGAQATEPLRHPALKNRFGPKQLIRVPRSLWVCGTPLITRAVNLLAEQRRALFPSSTKAGL